MNIIADRVQMRLKKMKLFPDEGYCYIFNKIPYISLYFYYIIVVKKMMSDKHILCDVLKTKMTVMTQLISLTLSISLYQHWHMSMIYYQFTRNIPIKNTLSL